MLVPRKAPVEHRRASVASAPGVRIAKVAPGIVAKALLQGAVACRDGGPRTKMVLQYIVERALAVALLHNSEHSEGTGQVRETVRYSGVAGGLRDVLAVSNITFRADRVAHMLLHEDPLAVVAVAVNQAVAALLDLMNLVETRVSDRLRCGWEHSRWSDSLVHGVGIGGDIISVAVHSYDNYK